MSTPIYNRAGRVYTLAGEAVNPLDVQLNIQENTQPYNTDDTLGVFVDKTYTQILNFKITEVESVEGRIAVNDSYGQAFNKVQTQINANSASIEILQGRDVFVPAQYYKKTEVDSLIAPLQARAVFTPANYYTKTEIDAKITAIEARLTALEGATP